MWIIIESKILVVLSFVFLKLKQGVSVQNWIILENKFVGNVLRRLIIMSYILTLHKWKCIIV